MRALQVTLFLGLTAAVTYLWFFRRSEQFFIAETPIRRLSAFVDSQHGKIFSPLSNQDTIISAQELRQIQATLQDLTAKSKSEAEKKLYSIGGSVCILLLNAIAEREKHSRRLADAHSKG